MPPEIYEFFERYAGVSFDFTEDINNISGDIAFIEPYAWQSGIENIEQNLQRALDVVEEHWTWLTDEMPTKGDIKKMVAEYVLAGLIRNLNHLKQSLGVERKDISSYEDFEIQMHTIGKLIEMLSLNSLDEVMSKKLFDTYLTEDEDDDNPFVSVLGLDERDVPELWMTVSNIKEEYWAIHDEDDE